MWDPMKHKRYGTLFNTNRLPNLWDTANKNTIKYIKYMGHPATQNTLWDTQ
jgi:hypothetical protein